MSKDDEGTGEREGVITQVLTGVEDRVKVVTYDTIIVGKRV